MALELSVCLAHSSLECILLLLVAASNSRKQEGRAQDSSSGSKCLQIPQMMGE